MKVYPYPPIESDRLLPDDPYFEGLTELLGHFRVVNSEVVRDEAP